jgi:hypothetical protein
MEWYIELMQTKTVETIMQGEIYTRQELEGMKSWRATFRQVIAFSSPDRVVCMMKNPGKQPGYFWKIPGMESVEQVDLGRMQQSVNDGRLALLRGQMPRGVVKKVKTKKKKLLVS